MSVFITILFLLLSFQGNNIEKKYSFQKKGWVKEKIKNTSYTAEGKYSGELSIDSLITIDPGTLDQVLHVGISNVKSGIWKYYNDKGALIGVIKYDTNGFVSKQKSFLSQDTFTPKYDTTYSTLVK